MVKTTWTVRLYRHGGKRSLDLVLSSLGLLLLSPIAVLVALLGKSKLGSPALFCQRRLGLHGETFLLHKFRSMTEARDPYGKLLSDEVRLVPFGKLLRSTSLDELPQLFDVFWGSMSLIGPRPLLVEYRDRYTQREWKRHSVRPGITGWAAVMGRNALSWDEKLDYDLYYVENYCLTLDLQILIRTALKVFGRSGVTSQGSVTSPHFRPEGLKGNPMS